MKLSTSIIAVKRISSDVPRSNFSEEKLTELARCILKAEGVINPPIVTETGMRAYKVVDGHFEYHAAVKAKEMDPDKGEMVSVFLIEPENEESLLEQIKLIRQKDSAINMGVPPNPNTDHLTSLETRLTNMETRFDRRDDDLAKGIRELEEKIQSFRRANKLQVRNPLDIFNETDKKSLITIARVPDKLATAIINERKKQKFESLNDMLNRFKGKKIMGVNRVLNIIDTWMQIADYTR